MISVKEADELVMSAVTSFGVESVPLEMAVSRILAEDVHSDRPMPPFDRVAMDGIAIDFEAYRRGRTQFEIETIGPAGDEQKVLKSSENCIEIMTGAPLPLGTNTVIRYEDLEKIGNSFKINIVPKPDKNVHFKGSDLQEGDLILRKDAEIKAIDINALATVGKSEILCYKNPSIAVISSGNELVEVHEKPEDYQIRKSNVHMIQARLRQLGVPSTRFHFKDESDEIFQQLKALEENYDIIILSGGVSKGKFDFIPAVLDQLNYEKLFHRVAQKPGKPFWFGKKANKVVFAFPGNPVSTLMCFHRYFIPWLNASMHKPQRKIYAALSTAIDIPMSLTYFAETKISFDPSGQLLAEIHRGNGSGDLVNPTICDGFLELPPSDGTHEKGAVFPFIPFYPIV